MKKFFLKSHSRIHQFPVLTDSANFQGNGETAKPTNPPCLGWGFVAFQLSKVHNSWGLLGFKRRAVKRSATDSAFLFNPFEINVATDQKLHETSDAFEGFWRLSKAFEGFPTLPAVPDAPVLPPRSSLALQARVARAHVLCCRRGHLLPPETQLIAPTRPGVFHDDQLRSSTSKQEKNKAEQPEQLVLKRNGL